VLYKNLFVNPVMFCKYDSQPALKLSSATQ